ncbi:MAG TPA: ABC transporter permease, partial [Acidimicrobiia bacterium]|nr:ABC transporter permease [Acidimicrobiia bacterium]
MAVADPYAPPSVGTMRGRAVVRARRRRRSRAAILDRVAIGVLLALTAGAFLIPILAPYKPNLVAGNSFIGPGRHFLLGTDEVGRDIFSRVLYGLRTSWFASIEVIASGVLVGGTIALVAGTAGGWVDNLLM